MRGKKGVTAERRDGAAKALLSMGFQGLPQMIEQPAQPEWLKQLTAIRVERITYQLGAIQQTEIPITIGEETPGDVVKVHASGVIERLDNANYVPLAQRGGPVDAVIRDVTPETGGLGGNE